MAPMVGGHRIASHCQHLVVGQVVHRAGTRATMIPFHRPVEGQMAATVGRGRRGIRDLTHDAHNFSEMTSDGRACVRGTTI